MAWWQMTAVAAAVAWGHGGAWRELGRVFGVVWVVQAVAWLLWTVFVYPDFVSPLRRLPQPPGAHWLLGHSREVVLEQPGAAYRRWVATIKHEGLIRYKFVLNTERLLVASPEALAEMLVAKCYDFEKPLTVRNALEPTLGRGVLLAEGDDHRVQRRHLNAAFSARQVRGLYRVFWAKARQSVEAMTAVCGGDDEARIDISAMASRTTLDIIGLAGMGVNFGAVEDEDAVLARTYRRLMRPSWQASLVTVLGVWLPPGALRALPLRRNAEIREGAATIRGVCREMVRARRQQAWATPSSSPPPSPSPPSPSPSPPPLARSSSLNPPSSSAPPPPSSPSCPAPADDASSPAYTALPTDILSVAVDSGLFTDDNLVDQAMTLLAAGHDTTASALTWAIYLLARHPDKQQRLRDEIRATLPPLDAGDYDDGIGAVTCGDIEGMPYLWAACSEALRISGPIRQTFRKAVRDTTLCGQPVPKGTQVAVVPAAINVDPALWGPDAREFRPERWLSGGGHDDDDDDPGGAGGGHHGGDGDDHGGGGQGRVPNGGASSNFAFLTFLHGPRTCIAANFARAELACLVAAWIGRFDFALADASMADEANLAFKRTPSAIPVGGMPMRTRVVEGW